MLTRFITWLNNNGAEGAALYFKEYTNTMRGVYSSENISSGTNIMKIPINMIIHNELAEKKSVTVKKLMQNNVNFISPAHVYISIYIIETLDDPTHFFYPYYQILPENLNNVPLFWSDYELDELEGSNFLKLINNKIIKLKKEYNKIIDSVPYFKNLANFAKYKYIRLLVASRNFTLKINHRVLNGLVPWADMLNHEYPPQTTWGFKEGFFYIDSIKDINANVEIMDSYGLKTNAKYLLHYGFTVEDSANRSNDNVSVVIKSQEKILTTPFNNYALQNLLDIFRKKNYNTGEIYKNLETEKKNLYKIAKELMFILDKYKTTYKNDKILLNSGTIDKFSNKYNILVIISTEKNIIQEYIAGIFKILEYIDMKPGERKLDQAYLIDYFNQFKDLV